MIPLMNQLGVDARWNIIQGDNEFYQVTKKFHNALHNRKEDITDKDFAIYMENTLKNIKEMELKGDIMFIHDPQPAGLIAREKRDRRKMDLALPYRYLAP